MGVPFLDQGPMRVEEFYAFTDTRPDEEKWELIDGEPLLNPTPSYLHQKIVRNLLVLLDEAARQSRGGWEVLPGLGVRLSDTSVPVPDVLIRPDKFIDGRDCDDMIVAFEVLSPSTAKRDLRWKRTAYASLPDAATICGRGSGRGRYPQLRPRGRRRAVSASGDLRAIDEDLDLPAIGVRARLSEIYRGLGLAGA